MTVEQHGLNALTFFVMFVAYVIHDLNNRVMIVAT